MRVSPTTHMDQDAAPIRSKAPVEGTPSTIIDVSFFWSASPPVCVIMKLWLPGTGRISIETEGIFSGGGWERMPTAIIEMTVAMTAIMIIDPKTSEAPLWRSEGFTAHPPTPYTRAV